MPGLKRGSVEAAGGGFGTCPFRLEGFFRCGFSGGGAAAEEAGPAAAAVPAALVEVAGASVSP